MAELTREQWEHMQLDAIEARDQLFSEVCRQPRLLELWRRWQSAEHALIDAGRSRRESEAHGA
ncbi:MAG TPA: hypothetical protein VGJ84_21905 [Polyangiaceae bacterium]|jgi:hypothetical protein